MAANTLQELIAASGQGDHAAFRTLIELFEDRLFAYIYVRVQSRDDALDALQDVLVELWKSLPRFRYRSDTEFYGFLYTIAKRRVYAIWEQAEMLPLPEGEEIEDRGTDKPLERLIIEDALRALDDTSREIVVLRHWLRYSFGEIAAMLRLEEGTVRVRHHRALKTLHDSLATYAS